MDNPINWSFGIGSLFGIRIRLHILFLFGAVVILARSVDAAGQGHVLRAMADSAGMFLILFLIVLLHEFGHCFGARYTGGDAEEILLWPLGGLASVNPPHTPRATLVTTAAGPLVNVVICAITSVALVLLGKSIWAVPWNPFAPFSPRVPWTSELHWWVLVTFSLSYMLLLFNLLPVFPLDGGRMLQSVLWQTHGFQRATIVACRVGMVGAIAIAVMGILTGALLMLFIAIFGYITCLQERQRLQMHDFLDENEFGYDFSQGHTSFEKSSQQHESRPGYFARRKAAKLEQKRQREREELERHRRMVDEILQKISRSGAESLTSQERRILERETERQRLGNE
jgi:Zn-dependent protease